MCVKDYIREKWKVKSYKFIQIEDISFGSIESISRFSPNLGKAFKRGQTKKNLIVFNLKSNKSSSIFKKTTDPFQFNTKTTKKCRIFRRFPIILLGYMHSLYLKLTLVRDHAMVREAITKKQ